MAEALIRINLGRPDDARPWLEAAEAAMAVPGAPGDPVIMAGGLASARSLVRLLAGDTPGGVSEGRHAMAITPAAATWWRALACMALGIALHAAGEGEEAYPILEEAADQGRACQASALALVSLSHLADTDFGRGDVALSRERSLEAIALAEDERHSEYPHAAGAHVNLARARGRHGQPRRGARAGRSGRAARAPGAGPDRAGPRRDRARGGVPGRRGPGRGARLRAGGTPAAGLGARGRATSAGSSTTSNRGPERDPRPPERPGPRMPGT